MKHNNLLIIYAVLVMSGACSLRAQDVLTGGYGNERTNADLYETVLSPATVSPSSFGKLFSLAVDGQIFAQPLYQKDVRIPGSGPHNVIFVATMHNSVYAFDADKPGPPFWTVNLGPSVPAATYNSDSGAYTDIVNENGILSTPVIEPVSGTLYVVAATYEDGNYGYRLHALDETTGTERFGAPVVISANVAGVGASSQNGVVAFLAQQHLQRPALLLTNDTVYVSFGSHGDGAPWHGWIMAYDAKNVSTQKSAFNATPNGSGGSFWQSGRGLAADETGFIYGVTSNGDTDDVTSYSDSLLKLSASLSVADCFSPSNVQILNDTDDDLGSMGALLVPGTNYVLTGGKEGLIYLKDRNALGSEAQMTQTLNATAFGHFNAALWARPDGAFLYTHGADDPVRSWKIVDGKFTGAPTSEAVQSFSLMFQGMTISANGGTPGSGILWVLRSADRTLPSDAELVAYDADHLGVVLWDSADNLNDVPGSFTKFANPTVANGRVYVPTTSNTLAVYGLRSEAERRSSVETPGLRRKK